MTILTYMITLLQKLLYYNNVKYITHFYDSLLVEFPTYTFSYLSKIIFQYIFTMIQLISSYSSKLKHFCLSPQLLYKILVESLEGNGGSLPPPIFQIFLWGGGVAVIFS